MRLYLCILVTVLNLIGCGGKGSVYATATDNAVGAVTGQGAGGATGSPSEPGGSGGAGGGSGSGAVTSYTGTYKIPGYNITITITDNDTSLSLYINYEDFGSSVGGTLTRIQSDAGTPQGFAIPTYRNESYEARKLNNLRRFETTVVTVQKAGVINGKLSVYFKQGNQVFGAPKVD